MVFAYIVNCRGLKPGIYNDYMSAARDYMYLRRVNRACNIRAISKKEFFRRMYNGRL